MPEAAAKKALLIAAANYDQAGELPNLRTPSNDVAELKRALTHRNCGFDVRTLVDPDNNAFSKAVVTLFAEARPDDTVLLYYSGHGKLAQSGGLRLCARDTEEKFLSVVSVGVTFIKEQIDTTRATRVILLLDCCYSGLAAGAFKGDVVSAIRDAVGAGKGKFVVTSSSRVETSIELAGDRNSLFTKWLVRGLDTFEADENKDDVITLDELVDYTSAGVQSERPEQHPQKLGFETTGGMVEFSRRPGGALQRPSVTATWLGDVVHDIRTKNTIYFLGSGIYGSGPLSTFELINTVGREATLDVTQQNSLATATEYWFHVRGTRGRFLRDYRRVLSEQMGRCSRPAAHDFLANLEPPWLVISTTHDLLLENLLRERGEAFTLVAHIIGPEDGENLGRIIVMRFAPELTVDICNCDKLQVDLAKDRIIYKLLGSPCLADLAPDPGKVDLTSLDTAVVTEADHIAFLGDLRNKRTSIPTAFSRCFRNSSVLFLGYELHVWNYRLVARVCLAENARRGFSQAPPMYAVRQPASSFEEVFWQRLPTTMLDIDVDSFIRAVETARPG